MKGKLATFIIKLFNTEPVSALFYTGATCSYISASLYDQISKEVAMTKKHLRVGQGDGTSLGPKGLVRLLIKINDNHFEHLSIICQNLKQALLFGMDFADCYKIRIDLDHIGDSYLWYKGRKFTSTWYSSAMPQCATGITNHITNMDTTCNQLGITLVTTMTMTILPHHMAVIPVRPSSHSLCSTSITTWLIEVIEIPLFYTEQLYLCVIDTKHRFYDRHQSTNALC